MKRILFGVVAVGVLAVVPAMAHHSFADQYDPTKLITLEGTVTKVDWVKPHIYYYIDAAGPDGRLERWAIEGSTPANLQRRGVKDGLKIGDSITVDGFLSRNGSNRVNGRFVTFAHGKKVFVGANDGAPEVPE